MTQPSIATQVDLTQIDQFSEIIIRGGTMQAASAAQHLMQRYEIDQRFTPPIYGLSCVFRQGATVSVLARAAAFPNNALSISIVNALMRELTAVQHELILYISPTKDIADHHTLAVAANGVPQQTLMPQVAKALIRAFIVIDNPLKKKP